MEGPGSPAAERVLTPEALEFVAELQRRVGTERADLLQRRARRQQDFAKGVQPGFLEPTRSIRETAWEVAPAPPDLDDRRVEITGPVERKMMINALNSGASVFMADFEDSLSPTWENVVEGQANLIDAVRRDLAFTSPDGKEYQLNDRLATLMVRPRGWHLVERHLLVDDAAGLRQPVRLRPLLLPQRRGAAAAAAPAPTSTCRSWRATSRRGSGTRSSSSPRTCCGSRAAPSAPPC